jgi:hypothetical protein
MKGSALYKVPSTKQSKPELPWLSFDIYDSLDKIKSAFPEVNDWKIQLWFVEQSTLANITPSFPDAKIQFHLLLNHPDVPKEVLEFIIGHELIHLFVPPREIDGKITNHPPEFWEVEHARLKQGPLYWVWLKFMFLNIIEPDRKNEKTWVKKRWKKQRTKIYPTIETLMNNLGIDIPQFEKFEELI